jgi:hypothetical protein
MRSVSDQSARVSAMNIEKLLLAGNTDPCSHVDYNSEIRKKFDMALHRTPWKNPEHKQNFEDELDGKDIVFVVYIHGFFTNNTDLAYYVRGANNALRLSHGAGRGTRAYEGPAYATPMPSCDPDFFEDGGNTLELDYVSKESSKANSIR